MSSGADRLFRKVQAVEKAYDDLANEVGYRLAKGKPWDSDLDALRRAVLEADREWEVELNDALAKLRAKGLAE